MSVCWNQLHLFNAERINLQFYTAILAGGLLLAFLGVGASSAAINSLNMAGTQNGHQDEM